MGEIAALYERIVMFIFALPEGIAAVGAATDALAAGTAALAAPATAAGAVVPPGAPFEEVGLADAARIQEHTAQVAAMLALGGVVKGLWGTSTALSGVTYTVADLVNAASVGAVV
jgi:hypothetical protein